MGHCNSNSSTGGVACGAQVKEQLKALMGSVHSAVTVACHEYFERFRRHVYVTPRSYLAFLSGFRELYSRKLGATRELASSINSGLAKMNEAKVDVNRMKARAHGIYMHVLVDAMRRHLTRSSLRIRFTVSLTSNSFKPMQELPQ